MRHALLALAVTASVLGCDGTLIGGEDDAAAPTAADAGPAPRDAGPPPPPPSTHPIDVAIWPRLWSEGATDLVPANEAELCRRFALELIGRVPSAEERASLCAGRSPEQMARAMMAHPGFVEAERRFWIQSVGAQPTDMMATHLVDADRIYDALARGELDYDEFAARLVAHPVLAVQRPALPGNLDDSKPSVVSIFRLFLGRAPTGRELPDFQNLLRPWRRAFEPRCPDEYGGWRRPAFLDPSVCPDAVLGGDACTSVELGQRVTVDIPDDAATYGITIPCEDRGLDGVYYFEQFHGADIPPAILTELERPGRLLATRPEFWDQAAELALHRLLGWWRSTADEPATIVPEVRRVVADWFRTQPRQDQRELYAFILSSLLSTSSAELPVSATDPRSPWSQAPTRVLDANQYLDSIEVVLGREIGFCDPHTPEPLGGSQFLDRFRVSQPTDFYGWGEDVYFKWGQSLGGCRGATRPPSTAGLEAIFTHATVADRLCNDPGARVWTEGFDLDDDRDANALAFAREFWDRALLRAPTPEEERAVTEAMGACRAAGDCDVRTFALETCGAVLRSAAFTHE